MKAAIVGKSGGISTWVACDIYKVVNDVLFNG